MLNALRKPDRPDGKQARLRRNNIQAKAAPFRDLRTSLILSRRKDFAAFAQRAIRPSSRRGFGATTGP